MLKKRVEIKAGLMKEVEKVIDELLKWGEETREPNLTQIEGKVYNGTRVRPDRLPR